MRFCFLDGGDNLSRKARGGARAWPLGRCQHKAWLVRALAVVLVPVHIVTAVPMAFALPAQSPPTSPEGNPQKPKVNRTLPKFAPPKPMPVFSAQPSDAEIFRARVFDEPLVPVGKTTSAEENLTLTQALLSYLQAPSREDVAALETFLVQYPVSAWRASLLLNVGIVWRHTGYFSKALRSYEEAWELAKGATEPNSKAVADRALSELAALRSRLGRTDELEALLAEVEKRPLIGSAGEKVAVARRALWIMKNEPGIAYRCGPLSIESIRSIGQPGRQHDPRIDGFLSTPRGSSLRQMKDLAQSVGMAMQMARREADVPVPIPAMIHWKAGHFGALVRREGSRYLLQDPTFGEETWVSQAALNDEGSGAFLVPEGALPAGWRPLSVEEADAVWGRGVPTDQDLGYQQVVDRMCECNGSCPPKGAMATYTYHTMLVGLNITDQPVGYSPPVGPAVRFEVAYNERDVFQPQIFYYSNLGPKWTFDWLSYLQDDPSDPAQSVTLYVRGGGQQTYEGYDEAMQSYATEFRSRAKLVRTSPSSYERRLPDGSVEVYAQVDGMLTFPRKVFLTEVRDRQGNALTLTYDESLRLIAVTDAIGQVTLLSYELPFDPLKITRVTDPFGRSASFEYDDLGRLVRITDVVGLISEFGYESGDTIDALTTPYGKTRFSRGITGPDRWIETTDPLGGKERLEYIAVNSNMPETEDEALVPVGFETWNSNLSFTNSYFWDKRATALYPGGLDWTNAEITHWLWGLIVKRTTGIIHSTKKPLENRVWNSYLGQGGLTQWVGTDSRPNKTARVLDDDTSQIYSYEYNSTGNLTQQTDPLGRETDYEYDNANGIDLLNVKQKNLSGAFELLETRTYRQGDPPHVPATVKDAAGQTTAYTYKPNGQIETVTTPLRAGINEDRTTTYGYDTNGYLQTVTGPDAPPNGHPVTHYEYDVVGRMQTITDPDGFMLTFDYDDLDRLTKTTYPDTTYEETTYNRLDPEGRRDRLGRWSHTFYDSLRRVVLTQDALNRTVTQEWCNCGSLDKIIDGNGNPTTWERDLQSRITREIRADNTDVEFVYENTTSRLKQMTDAQEQVTDYTYFTDNNLKGITYTNALKPTPNVSFTYDPVYNRRITMMDGNGQTTYAYHPITIPLPLGAGRLASADGPFANDVISYTYDERGRVKTRSINGAANPITYSYDVLGRMNQEANLLGNLGYTFDGVTARPSSMSYPNGQTTTYAYFPNSGDHRLQEIHNKLSGGATLSKFNYTYDAIGNVLTWAQQVGSGTPRVSTLGYDRADQLTSAAITGPSVPPVPSRFVYTYDSAANRTAEQLDNATTGASYNNRNQLAMQQPGGELRFRGTVNEPATVTVGGEPADVMPLPSPAPPGTQEFIGSATVGSGPNTVTVKATDTNNNVQTNMYQVTQGGTSTTYTYDSNGNLLNDGTKTFEWDAQNRLVAILQGTRKSEFSYDGLSQRTRIVEKNGANVLSDNQYLWCELQICEQRNAAGGAVTKRYFRYGVQEGTPKFGYTLDHLGSVREMTDGSGAVRARYGYDPYGRQTKVSGDKDADFGYTGHFSHASGLSLATYRAYDPKIGRFLSEDPAGFKEGPNLYRYARNEPIRHMDPDGLLTQICCRLLGRGVGTMTGQRHCFIVILGNKNVDKCKATVFSLIPDGNVGVPRKNYGADVASYFDGSARCYTVGQCGAEKEERIAQDYTDAGPSRNYQRLGPNSNTYCRYQTTKAGCVPPSSIPDAPGY